MPAFLFPAYSFLKAGSVPSFWVTWYWIGVRRSLSSSSVGLTNVFICPPFQRGGAGDPACALEEAPPAHAVSSSARAAATGPTKPYHERHDNPVIVSPPGIFACPLDAGEGARDSSDRLQSCYRSGTDPDRACVKLPCRLDMPSGGHKFWHQWRPAEAPVCSHSRKGPAKHRAGGPSAWF